MQQQQLVIDLISQALTVVLMTVAPPLLLGLAVGLAVSIFQAVTSIQEQTLAFIPKIVAVLFSLVIFGPFIINTMVGFLQDLVNNIPDYVLLP